MSENIELALFDVVTNNQLSRSECWSHTQMSAFYLCPRETHTGNEEPERDYYFHRRYRGNRHDVVAAGFDPGWGCIGVLLLDDPAKAKAVPNIMSDAFKRLSPNQVSGPIFHACESYLSKYPCRKGAVQFVDEAMLYCLGEAPSCFIRRLFDEEPDQEGEQAIRRMFDYVILKSLEYALDATILQGSAPSIGE